MLSLEQTLIDQKNLAELCCDRTLATNEICTENSFYGIGSVIRRYAGISSPRALKVVVPHGIYGRYDLITNWEPKIQLPVILCYPSYREWIYRATTNKKIVMFSYPALYAVRLAQEKFSNRGERKGTIFFPSHSSHFEVAEADYETLAAELAELDEKYQPVTVCVYWKDYLMGNHLPFEKRGLRVVSAGHIFNNDDFLFRLYHLCSMHRYSSSNSFGGSVFFSIQAGCDYFPVMKARPKYVRPHAVPDFVLTEEYFYALCAAYPEGNPEAFGRASDYFMGAQYEMTPEEMRAVLNEAEWRYRYSVLDRHRGRSFHLPYVITRNARRAARTLLNAVRPGGRT